MLSKIFVDFCFSELTHNTLQRRSFLIFLFSSVQCIAGCSTGIQSWTYFLRHTCKFLFVYFVDFCSKKRAIRSNIDKNSNASRMMQLCSKQLTKTAATWKWRMQSIVNVSCDLCNSFMKELRKLAFNVQHKDGLFAVQISEGMLQIFFSYCVCFENCI